MRQTFLLFLFGMGLCFASEAQNRSPDILSSAGGIDKSATISLEWTLGEFAVSTIRTDGRIITEGFHQPTLTVIPIHELTNENTDEKDWDIKIFPNPVASTLQVKMQFEELTAGIDIVLFDIKGQQLDRQQVNPHSETHTLDFQQYAPGTYIIKCMERTGELLQSFKIIKIK